MKAKIIKNIKKNKFSSKKKNKKPYRIKNWKEYNQSLKNRGSIEFWIDKNSLKAWGAKPKRKRQQGHQKEYSNTAIKVMILVRKIFHLKLRQVEGFVRSIFRMKKIKLKVPNYTTISRRGNIKVKLPKNKKAKVYIILDSTGLKVFGEGEWKVRRYGYTKRRTWRKIHINIDADGEIRAVELTGNDQDDAGMIDELIKDEKAKIDSCLGDGGYDKKKVYNHERLRRTKKIIPPQRNAKIKQHGNCKSPPYARDQNLRMIRKLGRKKWKEKSGYHKRSLVETTMFRLKTIFGDKLSSRDQENQQTEAKIMCIALNKMRILGMPKSYAVV